MFPGLSGAKRDRFNETFVPRVIVVEWSRLPSNASGATISSSAALSMEPCELLATDEASCEMTRLERKKKTCEPTRWAGLAEERPHAASHILRLNEGNVAEVKDRRERVLEISHLLLRETKTRKG
jgi:hypothetical protein